MTAGGTAGPAAAESKGRFRNLREKFAVKDVRRLVHSTKVGLALTLAALLVLIRAPYYTWIGQNAIWAVITVVVVFETSAGATMSKGLNRGIGTVLAGVLALGAAHVADLFHELGEPIFIGISVFFAGTFCTFVRSIPKVKAQFDYGIVIFMLTFCMVLVMGYRTGDDVTTASDRLFTILIGFLICLVISSFLIPHWAGEDLHMLVSNNLEELGDTLEACVKEYLNGADENSTASKSYLEQPDADPVYRACRETMKSRSTEEALANFASWEPPHGRFRLGHPWKQYLKVGTMLRHYAYTILALHGCLRSEIQAPRSLRNLFASDLLKASKEGAHLLQELSACIRDMRKLRCPPADLLRETNRAADDVNECIRKYSFLLATQGPQTWLKLEEPSNLPGSPGVILSRSKTESIESMHDQVPVHPSDRHQPLPENVLVSIFVGKDRDQEHAHLNLHRTSETYGKDFPSGSTGHIRPVGPPDAQDMGRPSCKSNSAPDFSCKDTNKSASVDSVKVLTREDSKGHSPLLRPPKAQDMGKPSCKSYSALDCLYEDTASVESIEFLTREDSKEASRKAIRGPDNDSARVLSLVTFASLLVEALARLEHVIDAVDQLTQRGRFKAEPPGHFQRRPHPPPDADVDRHFKAYKSSHRDMCLLPTGPHFTSE